MQAQAAAAEHTCADLAKALNAAARQTSGEARLSRTGLCKSVAVAHKSDRSEHDQRANGKGIEQRRVPPAVTEIEGDRPRSG